MDTDTENDPAYRGRYAPSPTGRLHLGNLRTALLAWLHARLANGRFILRIDDLDTPRNKPGAIGQIISDLRWLGIDWDEGPDIGGDHGPYLQSERTGLYDAWFKRLTDRRRVFPCICSRKDVRRAQSAPNLGQTEPVYPGTCRPPANPPPVAGPMEQPVSWRFLTRGLKITSRDELSEPATQSLDRTVGDFVVRRRDGLYAYQFATVVDDGLMGVTDIVRGDDLIGSMPRQLALFDALGFTRPRFLHVSLMRDRHGRRMAKRDGSDSLEEWKRRDGSPERLLGELAFSAGLVGAVSPTNCRELLRGLTMPRFRENLLRTRDPAGTGTES